MNEHGVDEEARTDANAAAAAGHAHARDACSRSRSPPPSASSSSASSSLIGSVAVLCAATLGAGILALPLAVSQVGYALGTLLLVAIGLLTSFTARLLLLAAVNARATTYEDLAHACFPHRALGRRLLVACTLLLISGSLVAFLVIIGDTLTPALRALCAHAMVSPSSTSTSTSLLDTLFLTRPFVLVATTAAFIYPLCLLRSVHALERWSKFAVFIVLALSVLVVSRAIDTAMLDANADANADADDAPAATSSPFVAVKLDTSLLAAMPVISVAYMSQMMIFPIWNDLDVPTPARVQRVIDCTVVISGTLYTLVGVCGYWLFRDRPDGDFLNNLPQTTFYHLCRALFSVAIVIHYPVIHFTLRNTLESIVFAAPSTGQVSTCRRALLTAITCSVTCAIAITVPDLSVVLSLSGDLCAFPYCYLLPCTFFLRSQTLPGAQVMSSPVATRTAQMSYLLLRGRQSPRAIDVIPSALAPPPLCASLTIADDDASRSCSNVIELMPLTVAAAGASSSSSAISPSDSLDSSNGHPHDRSAGDNVYVDSSPSTDSTLPSSSFVHAECSEGASLTRRIDSPISRSRSSPERLHGERRIASDDADHAVCDDSDAHRSLLLSPVSHNVAIALSASAAASSASSSLSSTTCLSTSVSYSLPAIADARAGLRWSLADWNASSWPSLLSSSSMSSRTGSTRAHAAPYTMSVYAVLVIVFPLWLLALAQGVRHLSHLVER